MVFGYFEFALEYWLVALFGTDTAFAIASHALTIGAVVVGTIFILFSLISRKIAEHFSLIGQIILAVTIASATIILILYQKPSTGVIFFMVLHFCSLSIMLMLYKAHAWNHVEKTHQYIEWAWIYLVFYIGIIAGILLSGIITTYLVQSLTEPLFFLIYLFLIIAMSTSSVLSLNFRHN